MKGFIIDANMSLLEAASLFFPESSKTTLRSWIAEGRIFVDGVAVKNSKAPLKPGQEVTLGPRHKYAQGGIRIIYEDQHIVVIDKPEGILSVAAAYEKEETAQAFLKKRYHPARVFAVHRLDQETSGVMLFALSEKARDALKKTFESHDIHRIYHAVVHGRPTPPSGTWSSYLFEDANYVVHSTQDPVKGRLAITHYQTKKHSKCYSLLELKLETGKKNQIRVHCQDAGCSIVGDLKYGGFGSTVKRMCLHASQLGFAHPITGKPMDFLSPLPNQFEKLMN